MPSPIPLETRVDAVLQAVRSLDPGAYESRAVRTAFRGLDGAECSYLVMRALEKDERLALLASVEPAVRLIDWPRVRADAARVHAKKLEAGELFPQAVLTGRGLLDRAVLGPRFHGNAVSVGEHVLKFIKGQGTGASPTVRLPRRLSDETAVLLCYLTELNPVLGAKIARLVPAKVFSAQEVRPKLFERLRQELGLFAQTLTA